MINKIYKHKSLNQHLVIINISFDYVKGYLSTNLNNLGIYLELISLSTPDFRNHIDEYTLAGYMASSLTLLGETEWVWFKNDNEPDKPIRLATITFVSKEFVNLRCTDDTEYFAVPYSMIYTKYPNEVFIKVCECGAESTHQPMHSTWCPKF